jgi:hypothetical protein
MSIDFHEPLTLFETRSSLKSGRTNIRCDFFMPNLTKRDFRTRILPSFSNGRWPKHSKNFIRVGNLRFQNSASSGLFERGEKGTRAFLTL